VCAGCGNQWYCSRDCQVGIDPCVKLLSDKASRANDY
jgi:hypothetical protein